MGPNHAEKRIVGRFLSMIQFAGSLQMDLIERFGGSGLLFARVRL